MAQIKFRGFDTALGGQHKIGRDIYRPIFKNDAIIFYFKGQSGRFLQHIMFYRYKKTALGTRAIGY